VGYFYARSSINVGAPTRYWTQSHNGTLSIFPFQGFEINTTVNYTWQQKTSVFGQDISILLWNAYASQNFFNNQLTVRAAFSNILNQNSGISRSNSGNTLSETSTNVLGRNWLVSAVWHFKSGKKGTDRSTASTSK